MPTILQAAELIKELKTIKDEQHLSVDDIFEIMDHAHFHVSKNTIKKVFSEGSENEHFHYHNTLVPIARVLIGIFRPEKSTTEAASLRAGGHVKDDRISKLEHRMTEMKSEALKNLDFYKKQIDIKDERIDRLMSRVDVLLQQLTALLDQLNKP